MYKKIFIILILSILLNILFAEVFVLKDKSIIHGSILRMDEEKVVLYVEDNQLVIMKDNIVKIFPDDKAYIKDLKMMKITFPSDNKTYEFISNFQAKSKNYYSVIYFEFYPGALMYTDRIYTFDKMPKYLTGATYIRTACDDKIKSDDKLISFTVNQDVVVYIIFDTRLNKPHWMNDYTQLKDKLQVFQKAYMLEYYNGKKETHVIYNIDDKKIRISNDKWISRSDVKNFYQAFKAEQMDLPPSKRPLYYIYKKEYPAGEIVLGGNSQGIKNCSMYSIVIIPKNKVKVAAIELEKVEKGKKGEVITFSDIIFYPDSDIMKKKSYLVLEELTNILIKRKDIIIEISGFTNDVGLPEAELVLSKKRASAVANYLISKGVEENRLKKKGHAALKLKEQGIVEANRRVEIKIIDTDKL